MAFVEHADANAPVLHRVVDEVTKLGADNPDNFYQTAALNGNYEYKIYGQRNTIAYLSFGTQSGHYGQGRGLPPTGYIESDEIEMDASGRFELILSSKPQSGNWLPMTTETGTLVVRQTFLDRTVEIPAELRIERINCLEHERLPAPLTPVKLDEGLKRQEHWWQGRRYCFPSGRGISRNTPTRCRCLIQKFHGPLEAIQTSPIIIVIGRLQRTKLF